MCLFVMGQVVTCAEILTCVLMLAKWGVDGEGRLLWGFGGVFKGDGRLGSGGLPLCGSGLIEYSF